nr:SAM-dependent methyltransferase [Pseudonocardia acaciae]
MADSSPAGRPRFKVDADVPHSARVWNYWLGGKDNYPVDRAAGDDWVALNPGIVTMAQQSRQFLIRVVRFLAAEAGVRQFLDIGTGLPTMQNTHEVAQAVAPDARVVYVDNDPLVLAHARALLVNTTPEGVTTYLDADLHDPESIIDGARNVLNFTKPIAVMFMGVLGHVAEFGELRSIVDRLTAAVPSGSYLALWDDTDAGEAKRRASESYAETGAVAYHLRTPEDLERIFDGWELVEPGLVPVTRWRPNLAEVGTVQEIDAHGGVARKP